MTKRRDFTQYFDSYHMIVQKDGDTGDSSHRMGLYHFLLELYRRNGWDCTRFPFSTHSDYQKALTMLRCGIGNYRRHPDPKRWTYSSKIMSRDQAQALVVSFMFLDQRRLFDFFLGHLMRGLLLTTNLIPNGEGQTKRKLPDLTLFDFWAHYIRGFHLWPLYPLLVLFDLQTLGSSVSKLFYGRNPKNSDDINHILDLIVGQLRMPTPTMWLARKIYLMRPKPAADGESRIQAVVNMYFSDKSHAPPFDEMLKPVIRKYFYPEL